MARSFNGNTDSANSATPLNLGSAQTLAVSVWIYHDGNGSTMLLESSPNAAANTGTFYLYRLSSTTWQLALNNAGGYAQANFPAPSSNTWHHVVFNLDRSNGSQSFIRNVYVDNAAQSLTQLGDDRAVGAFTSQPLYVMSRAGNSLYSNGRVSKLAVWGAASGTILKAADVNALYTQATPSTVQGSALLYAWGLSGQASPEPATQGGIALSLQGTTASADPAPSSPSPPPTPATFTLAPASLIAGTTTNIAATGNATSWTAATTFTLNGGTGASITAQTVNPSTQTASLSINAGSAAGTLTLNDSNDAATAALTVSAAQLPVSGGISFLSANTTTINLIASAASGGTPPYHYQWYRSTTSGFTPGAPTLLFGATALNLSDQSNLSASTSYYYKLVATDAANLTVTSKQGYGQLGAAPLVMGGVGDSIMAGYNLGIGQDPLTQAGLLLTIAGANRSVAVVNKGVPGATTANWLPGGSYLTSAKSAFASAGVTTVVVMLGTNDAGQHVPPSTFAAQLGTICADLVASGYTVVLNDPPMPIPDGGNPNVNEAVVASLQSYLPLIDAACNGTTILAGDAQAYAAFAETPSLYQPDKTHPNAVGASLLGQLWALAVGGSVLYPPPASTTSPGTNPGNGNVNNVRRPLRWIPPRRSPLSATFPTETPASARESRIHGRNVGHGCLTFSLIIHLNSQSSVSCPPSISWSRSFFFNPFP